ncbi:MAG: hypothetical protein QXS20_04355 [Candidatus Thorarchaeota archaeon]
MTDESLKVSRQIGFQSLEPSVVFKVVWYAVSSRPGVLLDEYSEPESRSFSGTARFSVNIGGSHAQVDIGIDQDAKVAIVTLHMADSALAESYIAELSENIKRAIDRYTALNDEDRLRLRYALISKICWDRTVHAVLKKAPASEVYYQVAHGREMLIKAIEGQAATASSLSTGSWLSVVERLPRDEPLPGDVATELAKKSVEWKKETHSIIAKYLQ